ncbi:Hypothetical predicted protein, partial [Paramuricea clavata]
MANVIPSPLTRIVTVSKYRKMLHVMSYPSWRNNGTNKRYLLLTLSMLHFIQGGVINGSMLALELMGRDYGGNGGVIINTGSDT